MAEQQQDLKRVVTPVAILSFPVLFEAKPGPSGGKPKFSASFVFEKGVDLSALKVAVIAAGTDRWGDKFPEMVRDGKLRLPFREDAASKGYPEGSIFVNVRTEQKPQIVDRALVPITEPADVYPGCRVRASLVAFAYDTSGNKGVSFALNNVQKVGEGERLDSRRNAEDEFEADLAPAATADLTDLI